MNEKITIGEYNRELDIADEQVANGDVFTQDEVLEIIKSWKK